jgi:large subunit ribosomal protein L17
MRHGKHTFKVGRTGSHRKSLIANLLKSLIRHEKISTTLAKAKELKIHADKMITLAKKENMAARRDAVATLQLGKDQSVVDKLFSQLAVRYKDKQGGYTRIIRTIDRKGDSAPACIIEYV